MKQTIRYNTFETNSSSYHTLSIVKKTEEPTPKEIIKGQDLIINNHINYKTIGYTESYLYTGIGTYEKAQMVLRFMGYDLERQFDKLEYEDLYRDEKDGFRDWNKYTQVFKEHFYEIPMIQAFIKAIKKYIGEDKNVTIEFNNNNDLIETVSDEGKATYELFGVDNKEDLANVDKMSEIFYNIIFDDNVEMIEKCESNE